MRSSCCFSPITSAMSRCSRRRSPRRTETSTAIRIARCGSTEPKRERPDIAFARLRHRVALADTRTRTNMLARPLLIAAAALVLAACASTTLRDSWSDPAYPAKPFRKLLVLGVSGSISERRVFEDIMARQVSTTGTEAVPAYRYLPDDGKAQETALDEAVRAAGADGLLMSRVRAIDRRTSVTTTMAPGPGFGYGPGFGWYGLYSSWYPVTEVRQYDIATVETSLFAADGKRVLWSGMTETYEPPSVA